MALILVIEDEEDMLEVLSYNLARVGHDVTGVRSASEALARLEASTPDLIISDIMMPGVDGLELCAEVRRRPATALTPFLFVTAKGMPDEKIRGLRAGADDYVTKPFELDDLLARVAGRLAHRETMRALEAEGRVTQQRWQESLAPAELKAVRDRQRELAAVAAARGHAELLPAAPDADAALRKMERLEARRPALAPLRAQRLVGEDPVFLRIFEDILIAAASGDSVLVLGETGTGKTAVAEAIWTLSSRADRPLRTLNCSELAAGDPTIAAGKLFGYGKGSGVANIPRDGQPGLLSEADGGVLFLDEVSVLPAQAQTLLLLPLEGRPFSPAVGRGRPRTVDVKFVSATNRDLAGEVEAGRFPRDLFERLAGEVVRLPALREHLSDVPLLARHLLAEAAAEEDPRGTPCEVAPEAMARLQGHHWPGNVRELRRALRSGHRRSRLAGRTRIEVADLPEPLGTGGGRGTTPAQEAPVRRAPDPVVGDSPTLSDFSEQERAVLAALRSARFSIGEAERLLGYSPGSRTLSHRTRGLSLKALSLSGWDRARAARLLAGDDPQLAAAVARRLARLLDGLAERLDEPEERHTRHLLAGHQRYALEAVTHLRGRRDQ